jgi:TolA-binding protein
MLNGDVWEASLYYSQVEKMYEDDPMGHEAKFRNARLSFFKGDFEWSKAQLDVLKSSTSEMIANDAMQLALLIEDNLGLDSIEKPLKLYAEADFLVYKNQFTEAEKKLDSINAMYPHHSLDDEILMERAQIAFKQRDYPKALTFYTRVYTEYGKDILGDDALFKAAELEEQYLNEPIKAKDLYEKLIINYPGSVYTVEARSRFRRLRGDAVN